MFSSFHTCWVNSFTVNPFLVHSSTIRCFLSLLDKVDWAKRILKNWLTWSHPSNHFGLSLASCLKPCWTVWCYGLVLSTDKWTTTVLIKRHYLGYVVFPVWMPLFDVDVTKQKMVQTNMSQHIAHWFALSTRYNDGLLIRKQLSKNWMGMLVFSCQLLVALIMGTAIMVLQCQCTCSSSESWWMHRTRGCAQWHALSRRHSVELEFFLLLNPFTQIAVHPLPVFGNGD